MSQSDNPFVARWTAQGHTLCLGHWEISYCGRPLALPDNVVESHMNTRGIFSWLFPDDEDLVEGLDLSDWIEMNAEWLMEIFERENIPFDEQTVGWFYSAVNSQDWRCGSCGGCI